MKHSIMLYAFTVNISTRLTCDMHSHLTIKHTLCRDMNHSIMFYAFTVMNFTEFL
jgi:hypothetical protein